MSKASDAAVAMIVAAEVTSQAVYEADYTRPTWPEGQSGVTVGIGYDCGATSANQVRADWGGRLSNAAVSRLAQSACVSGDRARIMAAALHDIVVPWAAALDVFTNVTLPQTAKLVRATFPGADALPDDCFGALASLVYNRGAALASVDGRRVEMAQIRDALAEGRAGDVPAYLRAMKRLWPTGMTGLRDRRDAEASLFEAGLKTTQGVMA